MEALVFLSVPATKKTLVVFMFSVFLQVDNLISNDILNSNELGDIQVPHTQVSSLPTVHYCLLLK